MIFSQKGIAQKHKSDHNCQDSVALLESDRYTVGVIADGCGSGAHSEIGANLTTDWWLKTVTYELSLIGDTLSKEIIADIADRLYVKYTTYIYELIKLQFSAISKAMANELVFDYTQNYLLCTFHVLVVDKITGEAYIFGKGDGYYVRNKSRYDLSTLMPDVKDGEVIYPAITWFVRQDKLDIVQYLNSAPFVIECGKGGIDWIYIILATDGFRFLKTDDEVFIPYNVAREDPLSLQTNLDFEVATKRLKLGDDLALIVVKWEQLDYIEFLSKL